MNGGNILKYSIVCLLVVGTGVFLIPYIMSKLFKFSRKAPTERWFMILTIIAINSMPLYTLGIINSYPELTTYSQIRNEIATNEANVFLANGSGSTFLFILLMSISPSIFIYCNRTQSEAFDLLKPIVTTFSIISTILLFLSKTFTHTEVSTDDTTYLLYSLVFGIYPLTLAFAIGEYFVKKTKMNFNKEKHSSPLISNIQTRRGYKKTQKNIKKRFKKKYRYGKRVKI